MNNVSETQRQFNEACDRLESWLQMAEKNLGALKREPIKNDHLGLQEQLDRVRDFTNAVMAQEKLIDDLKVQGQVNSKSLVICCRNWFLLEYVDCRSLCVNVTFSFKHEIVL